MCGRFALTHSRDEVAQLFGLDELEDFPARFNIAPTQPLLAVTRAPTRAPGSNRSEREGMLARWGFMPAWAKNPKEFPLLLNARSETAAIKNTFTNAMRHRRVLIPMSGFYEWRREKGNSAKAQPYYIHAQNEALFAVGGLLETWEGYEGSLVDTLAILTCRANYTLSPIHHRQPVIIEPDNFARWLDCYTQEPRHIVDLMGPVNDDFLIARPISTRVNKVGNCEPSIQKAVSEAQMELKPSPTMKKRAKAKQQLSLF